MNWPHHFEIIEQEAAKILAAQGKSYSLSALEELLGVSRGKATHWKKGQIPHVGDIAKISTKLGFSADWLLHGRGDPLGDKDVDMEIRGLRPYARPDKACLVVGGENEGDITGYVLGVYALTGAGPAASLLDYEALFKVCVPPDYYSPSIVVFKVAGDSMEPLIRSGAFVGVDTEKTGLTAGHIYVVDIPDEGWTLKKVFNDPKARELILKSINPEHPDQRLPINGREGLLVGRAVWVMQGL